MNQQPDDFRDRLIRAQRMSPEYEQNYRREIDDMIHQRLTPAQRRLQAVGAVFMLAVGVLWFLLPSITHQPPTVPQIRGILVGAMFVVWSGYLAWTAARGRYDARIQPIIAGALALVIPIIIASTLIPGSMRELKEYVLGVSIPLMVLVWILAVRQTQLDRATRESMLELKYRAAELSEYAAELSEKLEQAQQE